MKEDIKTGSESILGPVTQGNKKLTGRPKKKFWNHGSLRMNSEYNIVLEPIEQACQRAWAYLTVQMLPHTSESLLRSGTFLMNNRVFWAWRMQPLEQEERFYAHSIDRLLVIKADKAATIYERSTCLPSRPAHISDIATESAPCCLILNCSH